MTWSICIFAHNEERLLPYCLTSLEAAAAGGEDFVVHVMVNGSSDATAAAAGMFAACDPRIHIHELEVADKANAWNDYVLRVAPDADMHIFMDGDVRPSPGSFRALAAAFEGNPEAYAAAALPASGRSRRAWAQRLMRIRGLSGNLYAINKTGLEAIRDAGIFLPYGAKGEDGLLSYLFLTDLQGGRDDSHRERLAIACGASFEFDSLTFNLTDINIYRRRLMRYAERHFQKKILYSILKSDGVAAMPENIYDIYTPANLARLRPRVDPVNFWFDLATLRRLRTDHAGA